MINITKYVLLYMLNTRNEVPESQVSSFLTQILPTRASLVSNSSPYELEWEIEQSIKQFNRKARRRPECGGEDCIIREGETIRLRDKNCCRKLLEESLEKYEKLATEADSSLIGLYLSLVKPHIREYARKQAIATVKI